MGRRRINEEVMPARFPAGTFERMDEALADREKRADLLREAIERELKRRERLRQREQGAAEMSPL
jgi:metal-responsive CopG/Arc/MetJ family transcriptional regulator